ncbi:CBS domain-containing protein [Streptomyces halobius]|uniref:CBS domain-containing protein n=1 Tax=Streptomyces halobius TaxID=2879846 RepID=A0ABY4MGY3_9ACTN|nr:CBS domain-containing protein [Streptomyces halobius]UQA97055.1 CBS domain-containing protein [Streptomyces halobius]
MQHSRVGRLMADDVVTMIAQTPFKEIAKLLAVHRIGGLPVVDSGDRVLGAVLGASLGSHPRISR